MADKHMPGNKAPKPPAPKKKKPAPKKVHTCVCCGKEYSNQQGNFLSSSSTLFAANKGYVPFCTNCLVKHFDEQLMPALDFDERRAMEMIAAVCDWYYMDAAYDMAKKAQETAGGRGHMVSLYASKRCLRGIQTYGDFYVDTIVQRRDAAMRIASVGDAEGDSIDPDKQHDYVDPAIVKMFGTGYTPEEYEFLDEQYRDWTDRYDCQTKAQEELFKNLSVAQLNIRIAQESRHAKSSAEAFKAFRELMDTAKITPKQNSDDTLVETNTFGTLIKKWEDERPIPDPDPAWEDVDGIKKYIGTWFFGHLCKMFRVENDYTRAYDEEISQFTVDAPVVAEDDEEDEADEFADVWNSASRGSGAQPTTE